MFQNERISRNEITASHNINRTIKHSQYETYNYIFVADKVAIC